MYVFWLYRKMRSKLIRGEAKEHFMVTKLYFQNFFLIIGWKNETVFSWIIFTIRIYYYRSLLFAIRSSAVMIKRITIDGDRDFLFSTIESWLVIICFIIADFKIFSNLQAPTQLPPLLSSFQNHRFTPPVQTAMKNWITYPQFLTDSWWLLC